MKKYTVWFIAAVVILSIGYDFWIIETSGKQDSISWTIIKWSYEYPIITFATGFLCGHLFWRMKLPEGEKE